MKRPSVTRFVAALVMGTFALVALAQELATLRAPFWPLLSSKSKASPDEWFSDVPWHQKLGTYAGNEIDVPLVLPYEALASAEKTFCSGRNLGEEDCMIETGVLNILGYHRIDTLYDPDDERIRNAAECKAPYQCTEVRLEVSKFRVRSTGQGVELLPQPLGKRYDLGPNGDDYGGFQITDGSTYAPQMLWEMAHYCDSQWSPNVDMQDAVCYADYFSPMNNGYNVTPGMRMDQWPRSEPWSVFPVAPAPPAGLNQCPPNDTKCVFVMGGFAMGQVPKDPANLQYKKYNDFLLTWFNNALTSFPGDLGQAELRHHFPWNGQPVTWDSFIWPRAALNPFLGSYASANTYPPSPAGCDTTLTGPSAAGCTKAQTLQASMYAYPRLCTLDDLAGAAAGSGASADKLRQCGLNYEVHPNGWLSDWPAEYASTLRAGPFNYGSNQYGRTSFLFAGVPGMQMPVSFYKDPASDSGMSIYEQVHNASIFSLFLPAANVADVKRSMQGRHYTDKAFYHTLLMSNHMESDPWQFADGIRGKVLWHNEYRMQPMYDARNSHAWLRDRRFRASFDPLQAPAPFHNNTCDGCHVRNGSGVPINAAYKLDPAQQEFMSDKEYAPYGDTGKDYTFTGRIRPMKLVFFDLQPNGARVKDAYYNNKIMNYYGDSFHVSPNEGAKVFDYAWTYEPANANRVVVGVPRVNAELGRTYQPLQIRLGTFTTPATCQLVSPAPTRKPWPSTCADINDAAIHAATAGGALGYMHLNGKRLGNLSAIESIPDDAITGFRATQVGKLGSAAGALVWSSGTRDGVRGSVKKDCRTNTSADCYIGRFGWLGDRASLEDQVANAAFVEMNITSREGYKALYGEAKVANPIRYSGPNCGAANKACVGSKGNSDLSERDIERMADYARWVGNPTRSEIQVSQPEVIAGEKIFRNLQCDTCHVIRRIDIGSAEGTMLPANFRARVAKHNGGAHKPFLSYIGTDLLMHDMGYLSQVGDSPSSIRDANGFAKHGFEAYVQKIRTPPLKGLRFNNYVTDAHRNTKQAGDPGCDFLLHDGRACSAIEAAFLHDGPAIKQLKVIEGLNALSASEVMQLRAFLYSL